MSNQNFKKIVLITTSYPYGFDEPYIENEIKVLSKKFESVYIICTAKNKTVELSCPQNVKVFSYIPNQKRVFAVVCVFKKDVWRELFIVLSRFKLKTKLIHLKIVIDSFLAADEFKKYLQNFAVQHHLERGVVFYSYWMDYNSIGLSLYRSQSFFNRALTRTHGFDLYFERHKHGYLPFRKLILKHLDGVYCISQNGQKYLQSISFLTGFKNKIKLSYLGVFAGYKLPMQLVNSFTVVSCSDLIPLKRVHLIAEALVLITDIKIKWIHFGDGPESTKIKEKLKLLNSNIEYDFKGKTPNTDIHKFYSENFIDLFLNTSENEGLPLSMMEAMSYQIPCIGTNVGGVSEIIADNENGYLLNKNFSPKELADLIFVYYHLDKKQILRENAYKTWKDNFNAESNYHSFCNEMQSYF